MGFSQRNFIRSLVLIVNSFLCFGAFYLYDTIISLQPFLMGTPCGRNGSSNGSGDCCQSCLGFSPLEYNVLVGLPLGISTVASVIAGFVVDRYGYRLIMVISTIFLIAGGCIRALGAGMGDSHSLSYFLVLFGGLLVDNAFSIVCVIRLYVCGRWFSGRYLSLSAGFILATSLCGSVLAYYSNPVLITALGLQNTLWCSLPIAGISLAAALLLSLAEKLAEGKDYGLARQQQSSSMSLSVLCQLSGRFWLVSLISGLSWAILYAFMGNSVAFQTDIYEISYELASFSSGVVYIAKIIFSPIVGVIAGRFTIHKPLAFLGCLCLVSALSMLSFAIGPPIVIIILVGIGFATIYTVMTAILMESVSFDKLGTANAIMNSFTSLFVAIADIIVGMIAGSQTDRVRGWLQSASFLFGLSIAVTVLVALVWIMDALTTKREKRCDDRDGYQLLDTEMESEITAGEKRNLKDHLKGYPEKSFGTISESGA